MHHASMSTAPATPVRTLRLTRPNPTGPILCRLDDGALGIRAGTVIEHDGERRVFAEDTAVPFVTPLRPGDDFVVALDAEGEPWGRTERRGDGDVIGGGHYAPGQAATARAGGDAVPGIDPFSLWDAGFRPACPEPAGMVFVAGSRGAPHVPGFWCDKYLLAADHLEGTSRLDAVIADGRNLPVRPGNGHFARFDYAAAVAVLAHHGKQLLSEDEFHAAAYGVTERTAAGSRAERTALDAPRSSACGLIQATGQRYVWGHDGDPDAPRAAIFGGRWDVGDWAGSRQASVGHWDGSSNDWISARGRSDHLQPE